MLKRPKAKTLSEEAQKAITESSAMQTGKVQVVKSYDNDYPVFDCPVNQKLLVYIPNHVVTNPDGSVHLRMDKFAAHPVIDGRTYGNVRCSQGVQVESLGLDGTCPLCDGISECWELYNKMYEDIGRSKGIDIESPEAQEALKQDRKDLIQNMAIKQADIWYTFPIVVIDCEKREDGSLTTTPKKGANGEVTGHPMWYSIRERAYQEKWGAGFDSLEDIGDGEVPTSPAGLWAILNFTYTPKSGNCDKMGSARALKVTFKEMKGYEKVAEYYDKMTEDWTPAKAQEVVVLDVVRDMDEMRETADTLLENTRTKLAMYKVGESAQAQGAVAQIGQANQSAENTLAGFGGATPVEAQGEQPVGELPNLTQGVSNVGVQ